MSNNCYLVDKSQRRISVIQQKESIQCPPKTHAQEHCNYAEFNVFSRQNAKSIKPKVLMTTHKITSILTSTTFHKLNFQKTLKKIPPSIEPEKTPFK